MTKPSGPIGPQYTGATPPTLIEGNNMQYFTAYNPAIPATGEAGAKQITFAGVTLEYPARYEPFLIGAAVYVALKVIK